MSNEKELIQTRTLHEFATNPQAYLKKMIALRLDPKASGVALLFEELSKDP